MSTAHQLVVDLTRYNEAYRAGNAIISDKEYDTLVEELRRLDPENAFLHMVEPEQLAGKVKVRHPRPMLSTEKSYTLDGIEKWVKRVMREAAGLGITELTFKVMAKLDGASGRNENDEFATRGDGRFGQDIRSAWEKGVVAIGGKNLGLGEIVIEKAYFESVLAKDFKHPRNVVVGILGADTLNEQAQKALDDGAVHFVPYSTLGAWEGSAEKMLKDLDGLCAAIAEQCGYHIDGHVIEVTNEAVKEHMGATSHHYRWQIAYKQKAETANATVNGITWQVGRRGTVTPVVEIEPVDLSGATIRRVTAHHAGMVLKKSIGPGAKIEVIRSGEVIPKIEAVSVVATEVSVPETCPACDTELEWDNDFLRCYNPLCPAQVEQRIGHWFKILGNADWFGPKAIEKIVAGDSDTLEKIYALSENDFVELGFGPGQSKNLAEALQISRTAQIEDWRFLAAFGVPSLGRGDSRNLLGHIRLADIPNVTAEQIVAIHGFGDVTSKSIAEGIAQIRETILHMLSLGFNLERTPLESELSAVENPIAGKAIVFTGKMVTGSRDDMKAQARKMGAKVQSSVSGKTDYLVCGEKVGAKKIEKAKALGVNVISEEQYRTLINTL